MMNWKRILAAAAALVLSCMPMSVSMAEEKWVEDFQYCVLEDGTAEITGYRGPARKRSKLWRLLSPASCTASG